ncbi:MAG: alpha/beta hydrolase [Acidobacteria bacterium]|nr:alpha/beta hydrolase [Acidobacteriota bacterium]MCA1637251.1 alpha/beta hydrolase [Acidobacteriota bacterium]
MFSNQKFIRLSTAILLFVLLTIFSEAVTAQTNKLPVGVNVGNLVGSTLNGTMSVAQVNQLIQKKFGISVSPTAQALDLYKITYRSHDEKNREVVLSGLVVLPRGGAANGLVIFNHGTIVNSALAPSRFTGKSNASEAELATLAFASGGYAVAMPDYLGLGDHKGAHPYPLGAVNSPSAVDIIEPARTLAKLQNTLIGSKLFVSGYSEGGAVAMWTVRDLERKSGAGYDVSAAALASGPYDLSDTTRKWLLAAPTSQEEFVIRLYLTSYMAYYFHKSTGVKLTEYFKPAMALTISQAFKGNISDENIIKRLAVAAVLMRSKNSLANVITDRFKKTLETLDASDPVIREMRKSDVYDWSPRTKMLLISLPGDKIVDPLNTEKTLRTMRQRGIGKDILRQYVIKDAGLNHITAIAPALAEARRFFDGGFTGLRDAP